MANETTTTTANDFSYAAELVASAILEHFYGMFTAGHLVREESIADFPSTSKDFPIAGSLSASAVAEGVDMTATPFSTSFTRITVGEVGLLLVITDMLSMSDIVADEYYVYQAAQAMAAKLTTDILALYSGFSNTVGATGVNLSEANILAATTTLMAAGVPGPYHGVLHPQQYQDLAAGIGGTLIGGSGLGVPNPRALTNEFGARPDGGLGDLYGVYWTISNLVPTANAGADRGGMIVNPQNALGLVKKWDVRVEPERDASLRAREIAVTAAYGTGELRDAAGVGVITDA